jgi:hypothetical protein
MLFSSGNDDALVDAICNELFEYNCDIYVHDKSDSFGKLFITYHLWIKSGWMNLKKEINGTSFIVREDR